MLTKNILSLSILWIGCQQLHEPVTHGLPPLENLQVSWCKSVISLHSSTLEDRSEATHLVWHIWMWWEVRR